MTRTSCIRNQRVSAGQMAGDNMACVLGAFTAPHGYVHMETPQGTPVAITPAIVTTRCPTYLRRSYRERGVQKEHSMLGPLRQITGNRQSNKRYTTHPCFGATNPGISAVNSLYMLRRDGGIATPGRTEKASPCWSAYFRRLECPLTRPANEMSPRRTQRRIFSSMQRPT